MITRESCESIAQTLGRVNQDASRVESILNALNMRAEKYGKAYCPCSVPRNDDVVCACKELRETRYCYCGLFEETRGVK